MTYDRTCPRCKRPAEETAPRVCCARCATYHHEGCWTTECASCGATQTIGERDAARARGLHTRMIALTVIAVVTVSGCLVAKLMRGNPFDLLDLVKILIVAVVWTIFGALSRLVRA